ncbi:MAG: ABC-1 protein, partial [uncultured bacterium]
MALEYVEGIKVTHTDKLKEAGLDPHNIAISLIHAYCKQIFIDGHYHADPHPGNIIVSKVQSQNDTPYQISLIDFGATAQVSAQMKAGMILFVEGLIKRETRMLSQGMKQMGFQAREDDDAAFDKIVDYFYSKIRGIKIENFKQINISDFQRLSDIFELQKMDISLKKLTQTFHVPKEWILLERTLILMMGLVAQLDPFLNPVDIVLPYVEEFALGKDKKLTDILIQTSKELILSYIQLPNQLSKILKKFEEGKLPLVSKSNHQESIFFGIKQLTTVLVGISFATFSYLFYKDGNPHLGHNMLLGVYVTGFLFV